jgi:hypothetical protein
MHDIPHNAHKGECLSIEKIANRSACRKPRLTRGGNFEDFHIKFAKGYCADEAKRFFAPPPPDFIQTQGARNTIKQTT